MVRRQVHMGRMQYAPTLPTEKAILNGRFRVKALGDSVGLSAALGDCPQQFLRPIGRLGYSL